LGIESVSVSYIGYRDATDVDIFFKARELDVIVLTKDEDFVKLLHQHGTPPRNLANLWQHIQCSDA